MRLYLPLTSAELGRETPPVRAGLVAQVDNTENPDQAFEDALHDASFASLELLRSADEKPGRVVAVGDVSPDQTHFLDWDEVESLMVDGNRGQHLVREVLAAPDQQGVEALLEELFDEPLEWFDVSERTQLAKR